jgi:hypothetical protein
MVMFTDDCAKPDVTASDVYQPKVGDRVKTDLDPDLLRALLDNRDPNLTAVNIAIFHIVSLAANVDSLLFVISTFLRG